MMYTNGLACALKVNGKVLREFDDTVYVPFAAEYSVFIKNLNTKRASVAISIDGTDVMDGGRLIVDANSSIDLERFVRDNTTGNRFKFIERTTGIEQHRGVGAEDGIVRLEFQFERNFDNIYNKRQWSTLDPCDGDSEFRNSRYQPNSPIRRGLRGDTGDAQYQLNHQLNPTMSVNMSANQNGITVAGSVSNQQFETVSPLRLEAEKHVMILRLLGQTEDNQFVTTPVTVKTKPQCTSCGHWGGHQDNFCVKCGTSLNIIK